MTLQRSQDINCILKLAQQKAASHRNDTPIHLRQQRIIFSTVTHLRHARHKGSCASRMLALRSVVRLPPSAVLFLPVLLP